MLITSTRIGALGMVFNTAAPQPPVPSGGWFCRLVLLWTQRTAHVQPEQVRRFAAAFRARLRVLWVTGRPVIFLTGLCFFVGALFLPISLVPSTVFFLAGLGALGVALRLLQSASKPIAD
jgi:hypothetical protein